MFPKIKSWGLSRQAIVWTRVHPNFFGLSLFCVFAFLGSSVSEGCNRDRVGSAWVDPGPDLEDSRMAGTNALLAVRCCLENMRWPDFLEWRACRAAAA